MDSLGDAVDGHGKDVSRIGHVDLVDKVLIFHHIPEFPDHDIGFRIHLIF
jgi:hypothetical protein